MNNATPELDEMLLAEEAAKGKQGTMFSTDAPERELAGKTKGRSPRIPAFRVNQRVIRYHPRTIITKLAHDAGVPFEIIAASFGVLTKEKS